MDANGCAASKTFARRARPRAAWRAWSTAAARASALLGGRSWAARRRPCGGWGGWVMSWRPAPAAARASSAHPTGRTGAAPPARLCDCTQGGRWPCRHWWCCPPCVGRGTALAAEPGVPAVGCGLGAMDGAAVGIASVLPRRVVWATGAQGGGLKRAQS